MDRKDHEEMHKGRYHRRRHNESLSAPGMRELVDELISKGRTRGQAIKEARRTLTRRSR